MRAETPSWSASNYVNVHFLFVVFIIFSTDSSLLYFFKKSKSFFGLFWTFLYSEFSTGCGQILYNFPNMACLKNRTAGSQNPNISI